MAAMAATSSLALADTTLMVEGVDADDPMNSPRFYDTGKGYYFSWADNSLYLQDFKKLYRNKGSLSFLGDLYSRINKNGSSLSKKLAPLTDDSNTCWAQTSINLVEYWHSYYGVFCKDSRTLPFGYAYDKQYWDETGGTLSLKLNLLFLDVFSNNGDCLSSFVYWFMRGRDDPYFSKIEKKGMGGYWTEYFEDDFSTTNEFYFQTSADASNSYYSPSVSTLTDQLLPMLGYQYNKTAKKYELVTKGQLVYLGLDSAVGGHAITCHGVELDDNNQVKALYVTNSDDLEYKVFKLYVKVSDKQLRLYTNSACTNRWEYADATWYISDIGCIATPDSLKDKLEIYEDPDNELIWTGKAVDGKWNLAAQPTLEALPDETSGWKISVLGSLYPIYFDSSRIVTFDDSAASGTVSVQGSGSAARVELYNKNLEYNFAGNGGTLTAEYLTTSNGGKASFTNMTLSTTESVLKTYTVLLGKGATWSGNLSMSAGGTLVLDGGALNLTKLTMQTYSTLQVCGNSTLSCGSVSLTSGVSFRFDPLSSSSSPLLTINGAFSVSGGSFDLVLGGDNLEFDECYALIRFTDSCADWDSAFSTSLGELSYSGDVLYLLYNPVPKLTWEGSDGVWSSTVWGSSSASTDGVRADFSGSGTRTVTLSGTVSPYNMKVDNTGSLTFNGTGSVAGSGSLVKSGSGSLTINTANTYSGGTSISAGTVTVGHASALGSGKVALSGGTLNLNGKSVGNDVSIKGNVSLKGGSAYSGALELQSGAVSGDALRLSQNATLLEGSVSNVLSGSAGVVKNGSGTVTLSGSNSYSGGTTVHSGTLVAGSSTALGSGAVSLRGGFLDMNGMALSNAVNVASGSSVITGGDSYSGALKLSGGSLTVEAGDFSAGSLTLSGGLFLLDNSHATVGEPMVELSGKLSVSGATEISFTNGYALGTHILFSFSSFSGSVDNLTLRPIPGQVLEYELYREGNQVLVDIISSGALLEWSGKKGIWAVGGGTWADSGAVFSQGDQVIFRQAATVTLQGELSPVSITVDSDKSVTFSVNKKNPGSIVGVAALTKNGKGSLKLNADNSGWYGNLFLEGGTLTATGAMSFGSGAIYVSGGTLNLSNKAVENDIFVTGLACIKSGKKFAGSLDVSDSLATGTSVNIEEGRTATLHGGTHSASLYGNGTVIVDGRVSWRTGSITTAAMEITGSSARFTAQTKGLVMNSKKSAIEVSDGGTLISQGKISAYSLTMSGEESLLDVTNQKPVSVSFKGDVSFTDAHKVKVYGAFSANQLTAVDSILTFAPDRSAIKPKAQSVSLKGKGVLNTITDSEVDIAGKMSVTGNLQLTDSDVALHDVADATKPKAQGLTVKGELAVEDDSALVMTGTLSAAALSATDSTIAIAAVDGLAAQNLKLTRKQVVKGVAQENLLTNSSVYVNGGMSVAGNLELNNSAIYLRDYSGKNKAKGLTVKGDLTLDSTSSIVLSGALSAKNLTLGSGSALTLTASKPGTVKVGGALTLEGAVSLDLGFSVSEKDFNKKKAFKIFSFKTMGGNLTLDSNLNELFGISSDLASLSFDSKGKAITLVVVDFEGWNEYVAEVQAEAQQITPESEPVADVAEEETAEELLTAPQPVAAAAVDPLLRKAADTLVQSTWGTVNASRAFGDTIAARGAHATLLAEGKGAAWLSTMGGSSRISTDGDRNGADFTLSGAAFGVEGRVTEKSTLGVAIGNSWGKVSTFSAFPVDQDSMHIGIYGNHTLTESLTLSWMATHTRTESELNLLGLPYEWAQDALQLDARLTWATAISDKTTLSVFGGLQYLATDSGESNGLSTGSVQNLRGELGIGASHKCSDSTLVFGELSFVGDMVRNNPTADLGGMRLRGSNPGRAGINLSVGAAHRLSDDWSLNASYSFELMQNVTSHSLNVGASYSF